LLILLAASGADTLRAIIFDIDILFSFFSPLRYAAAWLILPPLFHCPLSLPPFSLFFVDATPPPCHTPLFSLLIDTPLPPLFDYCAAFAACFRYAAIIMPPLGALTCR